MQVIAIASQKGGSGKSTLSIHLATLAERQGLETLLADLDPHSQTAAEWASEREQETPLVVKATTDDLDALLLQAKEEGFGMVILDLPPYVNMVAELATKRADITLVPCRPAFGDLRTLPRVLERIHPPFAVVLNACPPGRPPYEASKTTEARHLLRDNEITAAPVSITQRTAFADALNGGEAVVEYDPESKAAFEMNKLFKWVINEIQKYRNTEIQK